MRDVEPARSCRSLRSTTEEVGLFERGKLYTIREAATALGLTTRTIERKVATGELASLRFGASRRITAQALEDLTSA